MKPPKTRSHYRNLIKAGELINLIQDDILCTDPDHKPMSPQRVNAIKLLLNKVLPDLRSVELSGEVDSNVTNNIQVSFVATAVPEVCGPPVPGKFIDEK